MLYRLLRPLLFRMDPETVHELAIATLSLLEALPPSNAPVCSNPLLTSNLWGLEFPNPVGLAAGFDKNARLPHVWQRFGFGFAELGTVTALPQPGNPKPRIFRLPEAQALINRLGFNNHGADSVARSLAANLRGKRPGIPLGINIGKSAATAIAEAPRDYARSYAALAGFADYVTVNVSSPNTVGLRSLQTASSLVPLVEAIRNVELEGGKPHPPLLIKLAPDLEDDDILALVDFALESRIDGLIATNTTIRRDGLTGENENGGLSGHPLARRATEVIRLLRRHSAGALPVIGVGGIFGPEDALEKIRAGASLVQMYTGFVYGGPTAPRTVAEGLAHLLEAAGFDSLSAAVGSE